MRGDSVRDDEWSVIRDRGSSMIRDGGSSMIRVRRARGFLGRLRGLIGHPLPAPGHGLWIEPCAAVHTFGMHGALDLVFVSSLMVVQRIDANVLPGHLRFAPRCRAVLELRGGEAARLGLRAGARLVSTRCVSGGAR